MDKSLNQDEQKRLLQALEKAKAERKRMEDKEEAIRWAEINLPLSLADGLAKLSKTDLSAIRINLDIRGASSLNKLQLIEVLAEQIPSAIPTLLHQWDETRYKIIKQIADHGGHAFLKLDGHQVDYFKNRGIVFTGTYKGKKTLAMPKEIQESFEKINNASLHEKIRSNTEWIKLTRGMLYYYGSLGITELQKLIKYYSGLEPNFREFYHVIQDSGTFHGGVRPDSTGFSNGRVWDNEKVKREHQARPEISFYPFTKSQLLQAGEPDFVDRNTSYQAFVDFIRKNYSITKDKADSLIEECVYAIRIGEEPSQVLDFLQFNLEMDDIETIGAFMDHIVPLHNTTRQWDLKGYSPNELSAKRTAVSMSTTAAKGEVIDFATRKKVGRNDPCPCGSGKKFKKCCGEHS